MMKRDACLERLARHVGTRDIVVVEGLHAGDRVVVDGLLKVVPGQPVRIVESGPSGSKASGAAKAAEKRAGAKK